MKTIRSLTLIATVLAIAVGTILGVSRAHANLSRVDVRSYADVQKLAAPYAIASSSEIYVVAGAATTTDFVVGIEPTDIADLNLLVVASSSSAVLQYQVDYSDDVLCVLPRGGSTNLSAANSCNWYREDVNSTSGSVVTESALPIHLWTPGSTATTTHTFRLGTGNLTSHRFVRIGLAAGTANYAVWAQVGMKNQIPGQ